MTPMKPSSLLLLKKCLLCWWMSLSIGGHLQLLCSDFRTGPHRGPIVWAKLWGRPTKFLALFTKRPLMATETKSWFLRHNGQGSCQHKLFLLLKTTCSFTWHRVIIQQAHEEGRRRGNILHYSIFSKVSVLLPTTHPQMCQSLIHFSTIPDPLPLVPLKFLAPYAIPTGLFPPLPTQYSEILSSFFFPHSFADSCACQKPFHAQVHTGNHVHLQIFMLGLTPVCLCTVKMCLLTGWVLQRECRSC